MAIETMQEHSIIGRPVPKKDAWLKATGEAKYADDHSLPGMLYGKLLRSPHPHARILHIDTSKAERLPGVRAVATGKDFPGIKYGNLPQTRDYLPLALEKVRYIGDEVAAVAAIDEDMAEEALDLIQVEYEILPAVFDPEEAMQPGAPQLHDHAPDNISSQSAFHFGDADRGFADSDLIQEDIFETQPVKQGMLEPHACIGLWDNTGKITLWASKQSPYVVWRQLAMGLGIEPGKIRLVQTYIGGGFSGGKQEAMPMDFCAVLLSKKSGRPVKFVHTMDEVLTIGHLRHPIKIWLKTGIKKDGTLLAQHCKIIANGGAYSSIGQLSMYIPGAMLNLPYRLPNVKYEAYRIYTNNGFCGAMRGHTLPQICFARDSQLDIIAAKLGVDPIEIRLKNAAQPGEVTPNGFRLTTFGFTECLQRVVEASQWREKHGKLPRYRGIGIGCGSLVSGARLMGHSSSTAEIKVQEDGTVLLVTGSTDVGQGADTVLSMIAAEVLGVQLDDVRFAMVDTDITPVDPGTFSSRVTFWTGNAVKLAAEDARRQLAEIAAQKLEANPEDLIFRDRQVYLRQQPQRGLSFGELVRLAEYRLGRIIMGKGSYTSGEELIDFRTGYGNMSPAYTPSACVVEVEVDPETGQVTVTGIWGAHDCGFPLNPMLVRGQVLGASVMCIGQALYENLIRTQGKVMNPSFRDYKMPLATDVPKLANVEHINIITRDPSGPFGAKEAGEGAATGVIAAVANAVYHATGVRIKSLPISPGKVLFGLKEMQGKGNKPANLVKG
ncbi:MAG: molybdopterin-dependent oxidoreductase [Deltaproteobacteria bacterium]|nr:molybdopterin-dependent oxidoreductase [Deltaproteobacteria bacterium]